MAQNPIVTIEMEDGGVMKAELYPDVAPNTVNNFISLIQKGYYDGLIFHRVIPGFMIQGGDPAGSGMGGPGYCIKGEFTGERLCQTPGPHRGVLSMARAMTPDSAGSQFFVMEERRPTWTATTPPSARSSRAWRWWTHRRHPHRDRKTAPSPAAHEARSPWTPSAWTTPSRRRSDFSRVSVSHTGAQTRAGMVPTF